MEHGWKLCQPAVAQMWGLRSCERHDAPWQFHWEVADAEEQAATFKIFASRFLPDGALLYLCSSGDENMSKGKKQRAAWNLAATSQFAQWWEPLLHPSLGRHQPAGVHVLPGRRDWWASSCCCVSNLFFCPVSMFDLKGMAKQYDLPWTPLLDKRILWEKRYSRR